MSSTVESKERENGVISIRDADYGESCNLRRLSLVIKRKLYL